MVTRQRVVSVFAILVLALLTVLSLQAQEKVQLDIYIPANELSDADIALFEEQNPDIDVVRLIETLDPTVLNSRLAAGDTPDIIRLSAFQLPLFVEQGILLDLTPLLTTSEVLKTDDFTAAVDYFLVDGVYYGLPKDWSPDFSLFVNTAILEEANLTAPSAEEPLSYAELAELATQLTVVEGDRTVRFGLMYDHLFIERFIQVILAEQGATLYNEDFSAINLVNNEPARAALRYFYDLAAAGVTPSPINPPASWPGEVFMGGGTGIVVYGYWFGNMISGAEEGSAVYESVAMLPSATWGGEARFNPTWGPTGIAIGATSAHPEEAFRFFEWFIAGDLGQARAASGWGVPPLKSLLPLLPRETDFQQANFTQVEQEMALPGFVIPVNPYYNAEVFGELWWSYLEQALRGTITFDELVESLEADVNATIQDGLLNAS